MGSILTIDTGGTKTRIVEFNSSIKIDDALFAPIESCVEFPTPHDPVEYIDTLTAKIVGNFSGYRNFSDENVVVLATRGQVSGGIVTSSSIGWHDFPVETEISTHLSGVKVLSGNDAKIGALGAFAESKIRRGLYITIGTGIGGGMIVDGTLSDDLVRTEIGKTTFVENGLVTTWEQIASGSAFYRKYSLLGEDIDSADPIWKDYANDIAKGVVALLPILYPEKIIIGGSMSEFFPKYGEFVIDIVSKSAWGPVANVEIVAAKDPRFTVNRGALLFALDHLGK